jgi:tetratricopeptide (TPR) repeat protein
MATIALVAYAQNPQRQSRMTYSIEQVYKRALAEMKKEQWRTAIRLLERESAVAQKNWRFSWNLGWCYFKLDRFGDALKHLSRATRLASGSATCKWGLGNVYLKLNLFNQAEVVLTESLRIKESHLARIALALAYLSQGKIAEAECVHLEGLRIKPRNSEGYESYAAFLSDIGREAEAQKMDTKAKRLRRIGS